MLKPQAALLPRHELPLADHQVIQQLHIEQLARLHQRARQADVIIIYMENLFDTLFVSR